MQVQEATATQWQFSIYSMCKLRLQTFVNFQNLQQIIEKNEQIIESLPAANISVGLPHKRKDMLLPGRKQKISPEESILSKSARTMKGQK